MRVIGQVQVTVVSYQTDLDLTPLIIAFKDPIGSYYLSSCPSSSFGLGICSFLIITEELKTSSFPSFVSANRFAIILASSFVGFN